MGNDSFSAKIWFYTSSPGSSIFPLPPTKTDLKAKRSSGLNILKPRSTEPSRVLDFSFGILPVIPSVPSEIPIPTRQTETGLDVNSLDRRQSIATFLKAKDSAMGASSEGSKKDHHDNANSRHRWDERFSEQRARLKHTKSIQQLQSLDISSPTRSDKGKNKRESNAESWRYGRLELVALGSGGVRGGELRIYHGDKAPPTFRLNLPPIPSEGQAPSKGATWSPDGVQRVHSSVFSRVNVISLTFQDSTLAQSTQSDNQVLPVSTRDDLQAGPSKSSTFPLLGRVRGKSVSAKNSETRNQSQRGRSSTVLSGVSEESMESDYSAISYPPLSSKGGQLPATSEKKTLYFGFDDLHQANDWFILLRSLAIPTPVRRHRRLEIKVFDLQERLSSEAGQDGSKVRLDGSIKSPSARSGNGTKGSNSTIGEPGFKSKWARNDSLCLELMIDETVMARTTWTKAEVNSSMPFWGESLYLEDIADFSHCTLRIYRNRRPNLFAIVHLPLVSSFTLPNDERFPIHGIETDRVLGEIRLAVQYQEIPILPLSRYILDADNDNVELRIRLLYYLSAHGQLEGVADLVCRLALAEGKLLPRLLHMCTVEAPASGDTLFRSNTPLSKILESVMRLLCRDFLTASIGPTINRVLDGRLEIKVIKEEEHGHQVDVGAISKMLRLVRECWSNMYMQRGIFPNYLRIVFAHLFKVVKSAHKDENEKLRYKAVSSFVFLRLIGPALMRPHLFGLAGGLPPMGVQRTLTLLAKILHALAFFSDKDTGRDPELGLFSGFVRENGEMMIDYLTSLATPTDVEKTQERVESPIQHFVARRREHLKPEWGFAIPCNTLGGPVDLVADMAILAETFYERRRTRGRGFDALGVLEKEGEIDEAFAAMIRGLDEWLKGVHDSAMNLAGDGSNVVERSLKVEIEGYKSTIQLHLQRPPIMPRSTSTPSANTIKIGTNTNTNTNTDSTTSLEENSGAQISSLRSKMTSPLSWKWLNLSSPSFRPVERPFSPPPLPSLGTALSDADVSAENDPDRSQDDGGGGGSGSGSGSRNGSALRRKVSLGKMRRRRPSLPGIDVSLARRIEDDPSMPRSSVDCLSV